MDSFLEKSFLEPWGRFLDLLGQFLPHLLAALAILLAGVLLAGLFHRGFSLLLRKMGLDRVAAHLEIPRLLERGGISLAFSQVVARILAWMVLLTFGVAAIHALALAATDRLVASFLLYLPNVLLAFLILLAGLLLGNFFARATLVAAVNANLRIARMLARMVKLSILLFAAAAALEHLGIGRETVRLAFGITFGGLVLALALAFGLGGQEIARRQLERVFGDREGKDDLRHL